MKNKISQENNKFGSLDGLRILAAIGIIIMHVAANTNYNINHYVYTTIIQQLSEFVYLFMIISGFGMCCGYYNKIKNNEITLKEFYNKRYSKILPFFAILVLLDLVLNFSMPALYEGFMNLTLSFAFLPNSNISVIGVGWTLGVIFAFYMLFPFFVFMLDSKKSGWISLIITSLIYIVCVNYFFTDIFVIDTFVKKHSILHCAMFFVAGGLIYLYKDFIINKLSKYRHFLLILLFISIIFHFMFFINFEYRHIYLCLIFSLLVVYSLVSKDKLLNNKFMHNLNKISFEIYLCHMVVFRIVEKMNLLYIFDNDILSFIFASTLVVIGSILFSIACKFAINKLSKIIKNN